MWERALRRSGLPVAWSEGFSPRPLLSFGLALPTGDESLAEYLDVRLSLTVADGPDPPGGPPETWPARTWTWPACRAAVPAAARRDRCPGRRGGAHWLRFPTTGGNILLLGTGGARVGPRGTGDASRELPSGTERPSSGAAARAGRCEDDLRPAVRVLMPTGTVRRDASLSGTGVRAARRAGDPAPGDSPRRISTGARSRRHAGPGVQDAAMDRARRRPVGAAAVGWRGTGWRCSARPERAS